MATAIPQGDQPYPEPAHAPDGPREDDPVQAPPEEPSAPPFDDTGRPVDQSLAEGLTTLPFATGG